MTLALGALVLLTVAGALGVVLLRRVGACCAAYLVCGLALAGIYYLLGLHLLAVVHLMLGVSLAGMLLHPAARIAAQQCDELARPRWIALAGAPLLALIIAALSRASVGNLVPGSAPAWAARERQAVALGRELLAHHTITLLLLGTLVLVGIVSLVSLLRVPGEDES